MATHIGPYEPSDLAPLYELTILAFEPVFASFPQLLGAGIFPKLYPNWQQAQTDWVDTLVREDKYVVWVAVVEGNPVGLIAYSLDLEKQTAVAPATIWLKSNAMTAIMRSTAGMTRTLMPTKTASPTLSSAPA